MGLTPTQKSIIGQFINGRNAQDDFLQLADNHGGNVFAWIDSGGVLRGTFATSAQAAGSDTQIQFNNGGVLGADSQFTWDTANQHLIIGPPKSSFNALFQGIFDTQSDGEVSTRLLNSTARLAAIGAFNQGDASIAWNKGVWGIQSVAETTNAGTVAGASVYSVGSTALASGGDLTSNSVLSAYGGSAQTTAGSTTSVSRVRTVDVDINHNGSGTIGLGATYLAGIGNHGTGIITLSACFYAQGTLNDGGGSITASYGYYSEKQGGVGAANYAYFAADQGTGTNDYSFYSAGGKSWLVEAAGNEALRIANITPSTSGANQSSPTLVLGATYWDGAASQDASCTISRVVAAGTNPNMATTFTNVGFGGAGSFNFNGTINGGANIVASSEVLAGSHVELYGNTLATNVSNINFGALKISGNYWDGAASQEDTWAFTGLLGAGTNPTSTLTIGHTGTPGLSTIALGAPISKYNGVTLAGNGIPTEVFQVLAPSLTANYNAGTAKTLFTPTAAGMWKVSWSQALVIVDGASSTFPSLTLSWTDAGGITRTKQIVATSATNTTAVESSGTAIIYTDGSTAVQVTSASYASGTPATMTYALAVTAEQL